MHKYLPSKKFTYIIFSIILAGLIIFAIKSLINWQSNNKRLTVAEKTAIENDRKVMIQKFMATDTDGDGLKDWEESLWKTDPNKKDTDGDGTNDGDEAKSTRDPLIANTAKSGQEPNDKIDPTIIAAQKKIESDFNELSDTEKIAHTLFSQYIAAKGSGALSDSDKQIIIDTAALKITDQIPTKYTLSDIQILNSPETTAVKEYGNKVAQAFFTGTSQEKVENELIIIDRAVKNVDESALKDLDPIIESYSKTVSKLITIPVPTDAMSIHLSFLNDLSNLKNSLEKIQFLFTDPAKAINGMRIYQTASAGLVKDMADIRNYFLDKNIIFDAKEYGYIFINTI